MQSGTACRTGRAACHPGTQGCPYRPLPASPLLERAKVGRKHSALKLWVNSIDEHYTVLFTQTYGDVAGLRTH